MKPHPQAEWIKAKADGHTIQYESTRLCASGGKELVWRDMEHDDWGFDVLLKFRIKPAAPKWPETTLTDKEIRDVIDKAKTGIPNEARAVANAALVHALETGQVVLPKSPREQ